MKNNFKSILSDYALLATEELKTYYPQYFDENFFVLLVLATYGFSTLKTTTFIFKRRIIELMNSNNENENCDYSIIDAFLIKALGFYDFITMRQFQANIIISVRELLEKKEQVEKTRLEETQKLLKLT